MTLSKAKLAELGYINKCKCGKLIGLSSKMCSKCANSGKNNPFYGKKHSASVVKRQLEGTKKYFETHTFAKEKNPFYGKKHTSDTLQKIGQQSKTRWQDPKFRKKVVDALPVRRGKDNPQYGKLVKANKVEYNGKWFRGRLEVIYAKWLDSKGIKWEYEPETFFITYWYKNRENEGSYTPDFYLPEIDRYIEIRGWDKDIAIAKQQAFCFMNPTIKIDTLTRHYINTLNKEMKNATVRP